MQPSDTVALQHLVAWASFGIAFVMGAVMNHTNFCTMGSIADVVNFGDWTRMRMWLAAIGVAILGTQALAAAGLVDLSASMYAAPRLNWLSLALGGFMFGFGMVLGSGCGSKSLIRVGNGSLKSLLVFLMIGLFGYMTLKGVFGVLRVATVDRVGVELAPGQDLPRLLAAALGGVDPAAALRGARLALGALFGIGLLAFAFASPDFRRRDPVLGALIVGIAIVAAWYVSARLGFVAEDPDTLEARYVGTNSGRPESFSFVAPVGYTLELLMLWSDRTRIVTLGIAAVLGVIAGSLAYSLVTRSFRWESFRDVEDTTNHLVGGALMGVGGVTALGCTFGQAITGMSTLALGSMIAFAAIVAGAVASLRFQAWRFERLEA